MRLYLLPVLAFLTACAEGPRLIGECRVRDALILTYKADYSDDGHVDDSQTFTYNEAGLVNTRVDRSDGSEAYAYAYTYDADGRKQLVTVDKRADGTIDETYTYAYDASGNISSLLSDYDADGAWDYQKTFEYDDNNLLIQETGSTPDVAVDSQETYTYDSHGSVLSACAEDGECLTYEYVYDDDSNILQSCDSHGNCLRYTYNRHGGILTATSVQDEGTSVDTYDGCEHRLTSVAALSADFDGDGVQDYQFDFDAEYSYDKQGNLEGDSFTSYNYFASGSDNDDDGVDDVYEQNIARTDRYYYTYD